MDDATQSLAGDELQALLSSGIACLPSGISLIEFPGPALGDGGLIAPQSTNPQAPHGPTSPFGRLLYANAALERMSGLTGPELQAAGLGALLGQAPRPGDVAALAAALTQRVPCTLKLLCFNHIQSTSFWSRIHVTPVNQLPFMSAAWLPGGPSSCHSPESSVPSRSSSKDLSGTGPTSHPAPADATGAWLSRATSRLLHTFGGGGAGSGGSSNGTLPALVGPGGTSERGPGPGMVPAACSTSAAVGPTHFLCVHEDITARVSEELAWRSRDHALSSCSEGITIADPSQPDAPLVYVNDAFCNITGYSREDVLGKNCRFLQGPDTSRDAVGMLKAAVAAQRSATVELLNYKKNGEAFWNRLSITPVFNEAGVLVSYIGVQSDVTELIRRKEEEQRLLEAKVAAETATEAKSMFLANMSHEIRTPLNGMMATAQLLLASSLSPEQRELAETILESGNSLLGILGDILDFSKLDHGSIKLTREPVCLRRCIEACIEIVAPDAMKKGLAVYYTADDEAMGMALMADSIRMRQVLTNLLSNAVKFTDAGEVHVDVRVEALPAGEPGPMLLTGATSDGETTLRPLPPPAAAPSLPTSSLPPSVPPMPSLPPAGGGPQSAAAVSPVFVPAGAVNSIDASGAANEHKASSVPSHPCLISSIDEEEDAWGEAVMRRRYSLEDEGCPGACSGAQPASDASSGDATTAPSCSQPDAAARRLGGGVGSQGSLGAFDAPAVAGPRRVHISVRDTGIGIPSNLIGSLFQCFKQGSESMARRYGGTGLGLAISKRLAELMQGTVWVESGGHGEGCTFHFCVPADFSGPLPGSVRLAVPDVGAAASHTSSPCRTSTDEGHTCAPTVVAAEEAAISLPGPSGPDDACDAWASIAPQPLHRVPEAGSYASSTSSTAGLGPGAGGTPAGLPAIQVSMGQFKVLQPDDLLALEGRTVLVDISHTGIAAQVLQSCKQLGMHAAAGEACLSAGGSTTAPAAAASPAAAPASDAPPQAADILVVSTDIAGAALRAGWKGRPVVAVGPRELLTTNLYPLVNLVPYPVLHERLAKALVKSTIMLRWRPGRKSSGPKLTAQPISQAQIADFKSWRDKGYGAGLSAALLAQHMAGLGGPRPMQPPAASRGQYIGGQLALAAGVGAGGAGASGGLLGADGDRFPGGFMRPFDLAHADIMARRSSLDNSSLDRALVQQMNTTTQARARASQQQQQQQQQSSCPSPVPSSAAPAASPATVAVASGTGGAARGPNGKEGTPGWRSGSISFPQAIPEHTVLCHEDDQGNAATQAQHRPAATTPPPAALHGTPAQPPFAPSPLPAAAPSTRLSSPAVAGAAPAPSTSPPTAAAPMAGSPPSLSILVAEDNKVNQKVVLKVLQQISAGLEVDVVENGLQVLRALEHKSYNIILMDIHMPEMDGLEATRRIVATYPPLRRPRIIALSADTLEALHDRCREAGIEEFIVKPFRVEDLKRVMASHKAPGCNNGASNGNGGARHTDTPPVANPPSGPPSTFVVAAN